MSDKYKCQGCGSNVDEKDVEEHDEMGAFHIVPIWSNDGDIEPHPCGPIIKEQP